MNRVICQGELPEHRRRGRSPGEFDEAAPRKTFRRANAVGALATTRSGVLPSMPRSAEGDA